MADQQNPNELLTHQLGTYNDLRIALVCIAFALPILVPAFGLLQCSLPYPFLSGSLSAYYHHVAPLEFLTPRDIFVGGLTAAAACLYAYKGFSKRENLVLNAAAIFAFAVALTPTGQGPAAIKERLALESCVVFMGTEYLDGTTRPVIHAAAAVAFFLCLAYVSIWRSRDTLRLLAENKRESYNRRYVVAGVVMALSPVAAIVVSKPLSPARDIAIFLIEAFGVWAFAFYWLTKTFEMKETRLDELVAKQQVKRAMVAPQIPAKGIDKLLRKVQSPSSGPVERVVPASEPPT